MANTRSPIDVLLNLVPDSPETVLAHLAHAPNLAGAKDAHGYSLLHAASSYNQVPLLRNLVQTYHVSPNIVDEDNETPLFAAENVEVVKALLELGADAAWKNADGLTAAMKIEGDGEFPLVAQYLKAQTASDPSSSTETNGLEGILPHPPPLPNGVQVNIGTMDESEEAGAPDPEFRRRIEELAARDDFQGEEGQRQLRELVIEAVTGIRADEEEEGRATRRRRLD
ncbi:hypothetical protein FKW77_006304 [Venturia effusa]|uniref:Uncharacterized protein n=1 Tax=Venturia effusa TaxID=50376 RepID=A0A517LFN0_9PEZI|nr:hypothetical protein FKW77_006304 [Venturia effusa]